MSEKPRVQLAPNEKDRRLIHRLLYHRVGLKEQLVSKRLKWALTILLAFPITYLLFQDPDSGTPAKTEITAASNAVNQLLNVPEIVGEKVQGVISKHSHNGDGRHLVRYSGPQLIVRPVSDAALAGTFARAVLKTGASNGPVRAELLDPITLNGDTMAQAGSILLGTGASDEERLYIHFRKLITKYGALNINAQACDGRDQIVGIKGSKIGHTAIKLGGSIGLGFLGGLAEGLQNTQNQFGLVVQNPSLKNAALQGTAQAALDQSHEMMNSLPDQKPVIEVKAGTNICVIFDDLSSNSQGVNP